MLGEVKPLRGREPLISLDLKWNYTFRGTLSRYCLEREFGPITRIIYVYMDKKKVFVFQIFNIILMTPIHH